MRFFHTLTCHQKVTHGCAACSFDGNFQKKNKKTSIYPPKTFWHGVTIGRRITITCHFTRTLHWHINNGEASPLFLTSEMQIILIIVFNYTFWKYIWKSHITIWPICIFLGLYRNPTRNSILCWKNLQCLYKVGVFNFKKDMITGHFCSSKSQTYNIEVDNYF